MKIIAVLCLLFLVSATLRSQEKADQLLLQYAERKPSLLSSSPYLLIKVKENETVETLAGKGVQVLRQLAPHSYIILKRTAGSNSFSNSFPANANWKLSPVLLHQLSNNHPKSRQENSFELHTGDVAALKKELVNIKDPDFKIEYTSSHFLVISTTLQKLATELLFLPSITFAEAGDRKAKEEMAIDGLDLALNKVNLVHAELPSLNGDGMIASIKEQKPDTSDLDLRGRYIASAEAPANVSVHATIIATMIAGAGNSFATGKGVAWKAAYTASSFARLLPDAFDEYRRLKISVQNHSYGTGIENYYGADAVAYDNSTLSIPTLLHVFSSGNAGVETSQTGVYAGLPGFANITGSFKMSKNSISVGATDANGLVSSLSSRGPAFDGRLKPELVAFGADGSSGAAAIVSGISILCQQLYIAKNNGVPADAALIKAVLVNSAEDVEGKGINFTSGYGNVNAYRAIQSIHEGRHLTGMVARNAVQSFFLDIPSNALNLKVTIVWTDPPAAVNAFTALVNDLDVEVFRVGGNESWKPWILNSQPQVAKLNTMATRNRDSLNNIEQVSIDLPVAGTYEVRVKSYQAATDQRFHIVYQWDTVNHFKWTFPSGLDNLSPGSLAKLRWTSTLTTPGTLEYSGDAGRTWLLQQDNINTGSGDYSWLVPDSFHVGMLRMTVNGKRFVTDAFTVSAPLQAGIGFNCGDSLQIYWNPGPGNDYVLYKLSDNYMQPAGLYKDSFAIINKSQQPSLYYSVAPILNFQRTGIRSYALDYSKQATGCYFQHFLADLQDNRTLLHFSVGSLHNIQSIALEKNQGGSFKTINSFQPISSQYSVYDSSLTRGINTYRVKITFTDGRSVYSNIESVNYFTSSPFVIYPNPVPLNQQLHILSKDPEAVTIRCFSIDGRKLVEKKLTNTLEQLTLPLSKGIYLVEILSNGKRQLIEKLVVY